MMSAACSNPPTNRHIWLLTHPSRKISPNESASALNSVSHLAFMWLLPGVDQEMFLQVSQLGEAFVTGLTFERSLSTVDTKMNLHDGEEERQTSA